MNSQYKEKVEGKKYKQKKGKYLLIFAVFAIMLAVFFYIQKKIDMSKEEIAYAEKLEIEKKEQEEKKKLEEQRKKADTVILKYPVINSKGSVVFDEFTTSNKDILKQVEDNRGVTLDGVILQRVYEKVFSDEYAGLKFSKLRLYDSYFAQEKTVYLYLEGQYQSVSTISDIAFREIIEQASFQFDNIYAIKVFLNGEIFNACFLDEARGCAQHNEYFISKNYDIERDSEIVENIIFDWEQGEEIYYKDIVLHGVVFKESLDFLPLDISLGEVKFYNADEVFLGTLSLMKNTHKKDTLNNEKVRQTLIDRGEDVDSFRYVDSVSIIAEGAVANPRTKTGYAVIRSSDDSVESPQEIRIELIYAEEESLEAENTQTSFSDEDISDSSANEENISKEVVSEEI